MTMKLIRKKNKPTKTKVQFTKREWFELSIPVKRAYERTNEKHETKRLIYFIMDGDLINN